MQSVGLRERKKIETRRAIAAVALELALERGPGDVTVDDIADAAGVSPRTVFNYFGTKDEAILGLSPESRAETIELVRARPVDEHPVESLKVVLRERLTTMDDSGRYWRTRADLVRRFPELYPAHVASQAALEAELTTVIAERLGMDPALDMYPGLVVATAFAALRIALVRSVGVSADLADDGAATGGTEGRALLSDNLDAAFELLEQGLRRPTMQK